MNRVAQRTNNAVLGAVFVAAMLFAWSCTTGIGPSEVIVPLAVASGQPTSGCEPLTVQFSSIGTIDPEWMEFEWDFGDGNTSTERHPLYTYTAAGTFTAVLTVIEMHGLVASDALVIEVSDGAECGNVVVECIKYEDATLFDQIHGTVLTDENGQYVWLNPAPVGTYTMLIVKAGSEVSVEDGNPTEVYENPSPGVKYYADDLKDVSHWTICWSET